MKHIKSDFSLDTRMRPLCGPRWLGRCQISTILEYGHVTYQIQGNKAYNTKLENNLPFIHIPLIPRVVSNGLSSEIVMLHMKLTEIMHSTPCKQLFCSFTYP